MDHKPLLSDLPAVRFKPNPGDRLLALVGVDIDKWQGQQIQRAIQKFVGAEIRLWVVNCQRTKVTRIKFQTREPVELVGPQTIPSDLALGIANLNCKVIDLQPNDTLIVQDNRISSDVQKQMFHDFVSKWAGQEVEVIVQGGD